MFWIVGRKGLPDYFFGFRRTMKKSIIARSAVQQANKFFEMKLGYFHTFTSLIYLSLFISYNRIRQKPSYVILEIKENMINLVDYNVL